MDLQKAFDTVPHKRLLYKIEYYGITGNQTISDGLLDFYLIGGSVLFKWKQVDILISKEQARQILYLKCHT